MSFTLIGERVLYKNFVDKVETSQNFTQSLIQPYLQSHSVTQLSRQLNLLIERENISGYAISDKANPGTSHNHHQVLPKENLDTLKQTIQSDSFTIDIYYSKHHFNRQVDWLRILSFVLAIVINGALFILTLMVSKKLVSPLRALQVQSHHIANNDRSQSINISSDIEEINELGKEIEVMRASLHEHGNRMEFISMHDDLTGLPNRRALYQRLDELLKNEKTGLNTFPFALLLIDINNFKDINDVYGHHIGDDVLVSASQRIENILDSQSELICRLGGDEFAVFLKGQQEAQATKTACKIHDALEEEVVIKELKLRLGVSIGIALFPLHSHDRGDLLKKADMAMYVSKREGLAYSVYHPEHSQKNEHALLIRSLLKKAIYDNEFDIYFQPKLNLNTNEIVGFEALVRWIHPEFGPVSPELFVPMLEEMRLINHLTPLVLEKGLELMTQVHHYYPSINLAVNLSPVNLLNPELFKDIVKSLAKHDFPVDCLELEITESSVIQESERAYNTLHQLQNFGIKLSIDDFGTGYTSLSYLRDLPVDALKIDKSFVSDMLQNGDNYQIVRATIAMAHHFKLRPYCRRGRRFSHIKRTSKLRL